VNVTIYNISQNTPEIEVLNKSLKAQRKWLYSLSLWERVGVRVLGCPVIAGVSLILAFSQREKEQDKIDFRRSPYNPFR